MPTSKRSRSTQPADSTRRSPCPVACSLDLIGDKWTLLVIRDLLFGRSRFKDFAASPEGIPTNILSERLGRRNPSRMKVASRRSQAEVPG